MCIEKFRTITVYNNHFSRFLDNQRLKVRNKIIWTLRIIEQEKIIPSEYFKHLTGTDGLFEIRVGFGSDIFRIFCFFDNDNLIVLVNGLQKKTQRTPQSEIVRALKLKEKYEKEKQSKNP